MYYSIILLAALITQSELVWSRGYVLLQDVNYVPLDICFFHKDTNVAAYYTCYSQQLYVLFYSNTTSCDDPAFLSFNQTALASEVYDCGDSSNFDDFLEYTFYNISILGDYQCDNINDQPDNNPILTNKCVYEPARNVYKIDACTSTFWSTLIYSGSDSNCSNLLSIDQTIDECDQSNEIYIDITTCTTPINTINNKFGYIQLNKKSVLRPLNECIKAQHFHNFTCMNNQPYVYYWNSDKCNTNLSTADGYSAFTPFFHSCSTNQHDIAVLKVYENDNNCTTPTTATTHQFPVIVNECFNVFDSNNNLVSTEYKCDKQTLWVPVFRTKL